ncbi:NAD(P)/FAD-dependent oxidoreductase [Mangrovicoccus sp. HB161399]|uniref:NAD(P)/FAD-dependent oxidoreductase n=1 Tax=Mangrovicoccus sp. HB161399 TaxID=2720392 RepID=UPI001555584D|nr:NAD(P)/FAD-dependent oxidoreductase [Mangrovicoccus sp. HB161399]
MTQHLPTVILGAGAAGMMCAAHAGPGSVVIEHRASPGEKIRISGGGRCNFTNMHAAAENYISGNPHFAKSALKRYTQWDFLDLVQRHGIAWHEKTLGQLFCDDSAVQIIDLLTAEMAAAGAELWLSTSVEEVAHDGTRFRLRLSREGRGRTVTCDALVLATGGKSIPKIGATGLAYRIAEQFGLAVTETRPGLVPLTFGDRFAALSGVACPARLSCGGAGFEEALLFTHRGLSGPAVLQVSSYWREGEDISVHLLPGTDLFAFLKAERQKAGRRDIATVLAEALPKRLAQHVAAEAGLKGNLADCSDKLLHSFAAGLADWRLKPTGSEGYRKAEVTLGGIDTGGLDAKTMESRRTPGLHVIGEAMDVTGWLGGYNFQWAWSSGWAAGQAIRARRQA